MDDITRICGGDQVVLTGGNDQNLRWNNQIVKDSLILDKSGVFAAIVVDSNGCKSISNNLLVEVDPEEEVQIITSSDTILCEGDFQKLTILGFEQVNWNTGVPLPSIIIEQSGLYHATVQGLCETLYSDTISVRFLEAAAPGVTWEDTINKPGQITFQGEDALLNWYYDKDDISPAHSGANWEVWIERSDTFYAELVEKLDGASKRLGIPAPGGTNVNHNLNFNGQLIFDVYDRLKLESVDIYTDVPGERTITLSSEKLNLSKTILLDSGKTTVILDFELLPGINYRLSTDETKNQEVFGTISPQLYRTTSNPDLLDYPFGEEGFLEIKQSNFTNSNYYYFYNWKVKKEDIYCVSERVPLEVILNQTTSVDRFKPTSIKVYPNPVGDILYITELPDHPVQAWEILDINGRKVRKICARKITIH